MKKVFVLKNDGFYVSVEEAELVVVEPCERGDTRYTVLFSDGEVEDYFTDGDLFDTYEEAETAAVRVNEERDQVWQECREDAAEVYYADVLEQCLV